jgi:hypothetical protein
VRAPAQTAATTSASTCRCSRKSSPGGLATYVVVCASAVGPAAAARGTDWPRSGHPHPGRRLRHRSSRMSRRGRSATGWRPFRLRRASNFGCQRHIAVMRVARAFIGQVHRAVIGTTERR